MKLGLVIGRVTLNRTIPAFQGGRWLIVSPLTKEQYRYRESPPLYVGPAPSPIVYDNLGGGLGDTIGYVEGREASMPFDQPTPVDAINVAIIDQVFYTPES